MKVSVFKFNELIISISLNTAPFHSKRLIFHFQIRYITTLLHFTFFLNDGDQKKWDIMKETRDCNLRYFY